MLFFDSLLSLGGIAVAALFFFISLEQQGDITRQLYDHPFAVSNAAQDLKMQILELRNRLLELGVRGRTVEGARPEILEHRNRIVEDLDVIDRYFLGNKDTVAQIRAQLKSWEADQDLTFADMIGDHADAAMFRMGHGAEHTVDQLLVESDYVISFARRRAFDYVAESESRARRTRLLIISGAFLITLAHVFLLSRRSQAKRVLFEQLHTLALFDDLTGAKNRRSFVDDVRAEIERAKRLGHQLALIAIDLDDFKKINDTHGHAAGDTVLRAFGLHCSQMLRQIDTLGRVGGEEFAILLPGSSAQDAAQVAERIRARMESTRVRHTSVEIALTISVGVAELCPEKADADQLMSAADKALYAAKRDGKNRVVVAAEEAQGLQGVAQVAQH